MEAGTSPRALSLMPVEPLGEGGNSGLPSLGQVAHQRATYLKPRFPPSPPPPVTVVSPSVDCRPSAPSFSLHPRESHNDDLRPIVRPRPKSVSFPCMRRKRRPTVQMAGIRNATVSRSAIRANIEPADVAPRETLIFSPLVFYLRPTSLNNNLSRRVAGVGNYATRLV